MSNSIVLYTIVLIFALPSITFSRKSAPFAARSTTLLRMNRLWVRMSSSKALLWCGYGPERQVHHRQYSCRQLSGAGLRHRIQSADRSRRHFRFGTRMQLDFALQPMAINLEEVTIEADYFRQNVDTPVSTQTLSDEEIRRDPGTGGCDRAVSVSSGSSAGLSRTQRSYRSWRRALRKSLCGRQSRDPRY